MVDLFVCGGQKLNISSHRFLNHINFGFLDQCNTLVYEFGGGRLPVKVVFDVSTFIVSHVRMASTASISMHKSLLLKGIYIYMYITLNEPVDRSLNEEQSNT